MRAIRNKAIVGSLIALAASPAWSQSGTAVSYPTKPIRFVVPTAPGGGVDTMARLVGQALTTAWGHRSGKAASRAH
jgi:tripartite-type tricarboxylate transporter receptor subunit TctC